MRIASGLRAPNPKPSSGVSQRLSGTISRIIAGASSSMTFCRRTTESLLRWLSFPIRERDNSSDRAILLGDSPCEGSTW